MMATVDTGRGHHGGYRAGPSACHWVLMGSPCSGFPTGLTQHCQVDPWSGALPGHAGSSPLSFHTCRLCIWSAGFPHSLAFDHLQASLPSNL